MIAFRGFWQRWLVRPLIFAAPLPFVAQWCDIQPSWKLAAWTFFCIFWSDCTDGIGKQSCGNRDQVAAAFAWPTRLTPALFAELYHRSRFGVASRDGENG